MLAMAFSFNVSVLAADTNIIYGEKSNTKVYDNPLTVDQIFTAFEMQPHRACLAYIVNYSFTSAGMSSPFYISTGRVRVNYAHTATTNGTVTAKLVNYNNGAESMPITISGTAGQGKTTTLNWYQVPTGDWRLRLDLRPTAPYSNPWSVRADIYDG